jgi:hypothetical protein
VSRFGSISLLQDIEPSQFRETDQQLGTKAVSIAVRINVAYAALCMATLQIGGVQCTHLWSVTVIVFLQAH